MATGDAATQHARSEQAGSEEAGRYRQRRRTRAAIVAATGELLQAGATPSVGEIADAADVSRRTVYTYFPTLEQLLLDATLGLLSQAAVDDAIDAADAATVDGAGDPVQRVEAMIRAFASISADTLPLGRSLIRLTVDAPRDDPSAPKRGYRRIGWLERALEPLRDRLDDDGFERLVSALAMVVGWEAEIVLQDLRGLAPDEELAVTLWSARALVRAALEEHDATR
jgi:AcrR family transcriptional regulator